MRFTLPRRAAVLAALAALTAASAANAQAIRLGAGAFTPSATRITFSEQAVGTVNPTYTFASIPSITGPLTVSFAGAFQGQTVTGTSVRTLSGNPTDPLTLNTSVSTRIVSDASNPTSPVLSGDPTFNGPVVIRFSQPIGAIAIDGGFFNAIGGTSIFAYDITGATLGTFTNTLMGIETFGIATPGGNLISGFAFYITGNEPAGFAIDNVTFGTLAEVTLPTPNVIPEPSTVTLFGGGLVLLGGLVRRRRTSLSSR